MSALYVLRLASHLAFYAYSAGAFSDPDRDALAPLPPMVVHSLVAPPAGAGREEHCAKALDLLDDALRVEKAAGKRYLVGFLLHEDAVSLGEVAAAVESAQILIRQRCTVNRRNLPYAVFSARPLRSIRRGSLVQAKDKPDELRPLRKVQKLFELAARQLLKSP